MSGLWIIFTAAGLLAQVKGYSRSDIQELKKSLLTYPAYDKTTRPIQNQSETLEVSGKLYCIFAKLERYSLPAVS